MNIVDVTIQTESGCDISEGEYSVSIVGFVGALDLSSLGGTDDCTLIKEAIDEAISNDGIELCEEGFKEVRLQESGEWEDVSWHKYYVIMPKANNDRSISV
jgi:hypothetical protein